MGETEAGDQEGWEDGVAGGEEPTQLEHKDGAGELRGHQRGA